MATLETAIYGHLAATSGVTDLVSTRIYRAGDVPQSLTASQAYVTYHRISTVRERRQAGPAGLALARVQFDCYSQTPKGAKAICDAVRAAWESQSGATGASGKQVTVKVATPDTEYNDYTEPTTGSNEGMHRYILDVLIWYVE